MALNIVYSTDNNYAQHTGVSICSLLENNKQFDTINIYIIENNISNENKEKINKIVDRYRRNIKYIDFKKYKDKLNLNMEWKISLSSYARLFIASLLPKNVDKVLYYDCDTVIVDSLDEIWNINIDEYYIAAVQDTVKNSTKTAVGIDKKYKYINAGMLLINLKKWREEKVEEKFLTFIKEHNGNVIHHDQGVINGVLYKKIKIISPRFNLMTVYYTMTREEMFKYYGMEGEFYSELEIKEAIDKVVYIHYTPGFTSRPWIKGCKHPRKDEYWKYLEMTPWSDYKAIKDNSKIQVKVINFLYRNLSINIVSKAINILYKIFKRG